MKRFIYLIVYILILVSCSEGKMEKMRHGLDSLNTLNKTDKPFTSDDVQPYTDYFNQHGTPNDQLLAYYLLGRAYHEQGDAPMALQAYYDAMTQGQVRVMALIELRRQGASVRQLERLTGVGRGLIQNLSG